MSYHLRDFGSYLAGGRVAHVTDGAPEKVQFTRQASYEHDPRGHFAIEHAYVQYFIPERRNSRPPVVLVHGGGMSGSCWETTPDGRAGWLHHLLNWGYEVHVLDNVERGRAGFAPGHWTGKPMLRSLEEAWVLFRIGAREAFASQTPFPGQRFPVAHFETFARSFVPRWLSTTALQAQALLRVLERTGPAIVICHSQGGEIAFDAHALDPSNFVGVIAVEPSGYPDAPTNLNEMPLCIVAGDYLECDPRWVERAKAWRHLTRGKGNLFLESRDFAGGNSHMVMTDKGSEDILEASTSHLASVLNDWEAGLNRVHRPDAK